MTMKTMKPIPTGKKMNSYCSICGVERAYHDADDHEFKGRPKGFAAMSREAVQAIASKGGKAVQAKGTAHRFTHDEAVAAGKKGGMTNVARNGSPNKRKRANSRINDVGDIKVTTGEIDQSNEPV